MFISLLTLQHSVIPYFSSAEILIPAARSHLLEIRSQEEGANLTFKRFNALERFQKRFQTEETGNRQYILQHSEKENESKSMVEEKQIIGKCFSLL